MTNYKEILRLARSGGFSQREVASILHISRNTVSACIAKAKVYSASENGHVVQGNRPVCPLKIGHAKPRLIHSFRPLHPQ